MTYYLKYRPQTIDELDLTDVRERLGRIVKQKNFAHAYLFYGPRGTGKTSAARIVAKAAQIAPEDLIEIDAASHRGIDDVRELRERVGLSPMVGDKKAYIIDEAHMLTMEASNALLKTLEEPPPHVIFFLCTTELPKLPVTVVSRCVKIPFSPATIDEITRSLKRIAASEKFSVKDEVLNQISAAGNGSFRETQTLFEEAVSAARDRVGGSKKVEVTTVDLEKVVGKSTSIQADIYVNSLISGESEPALSAIQIVVGTGADIFNFSRQILENLRSKLISEGSNRLLTVTKVVEEKIRTIRYAPIPSLPLEIAALELASDAEGGTSNSKRSNDRSAAEESKKALESRKSEAGSQKPDSNVTMKQCNNGTVSFLDFVTHWPEILNRVKSKNNGVIALLSNCRPQRIEDGTAFVDVKYKFHKEQLEQHKFKYMIEEILTDILGVKLCLRFRLNPQTNATLKKQPQDDNINVVLDNELEEVFKL